MRLLCATYHLELFALPPEHAGDHVTMNQQHAYQVLVVLFIAEGALAQSLRAMTAQSTAGVHALVVEQVPADITLDEIRDLLKDVKLASHKVCAWPPAQCTIVAVHFQCTRWQASAFCAFSDQRLI